MNDLRSTALTDSAAIRLNGVHRAHCDSLSESLTETLFETLTVSKLLRNWRNKPSTQRIAELWARLEGERWV